MNCPEFQEKSDLLLDETPLPPEERILLEAHSIICPKCRLDFQLSRAIRDLCRERYHYRQIPSKTLENVQQVLEREYSHRVASER